MTRLRTLAGGIAGLARRVAAPFLPTPGTTEGAVYLGMVMLAGGFALLGWWACCLLVPGAILVLLGSLPAITAMRRGA